MSQLFIRRCRREDHGAIVNVCYRTGYMGEDLTKKSIFNDRVLFGYLFCSYYPLYEPHNGFVICDKEKDGQVVGYVLGSLRTWMQIQRYKLKMVWRVIIRLLLFTTWRYPESFKTIFHYYRSFSQRKLPEKLYHQYPAHLHINILPEYQRLGLGTRLLRKYEAHLQERAVKGIHLFTSSLNHKAVPFYSKWNYRLYYRMPDTIWPETNGAETLVFVKELTPAR